MKEKLELQDRLDNSLKPYAALDDTLSIWFGAAIAVSPHQPAMKAYLKEKKYLNTRGAPERT